jgi:hypothetical protein
VYPIVSALVYASGLMSTKVVCFRRRRLRLFANREAPLLRCLRSGYVRIYVTQCYLDMTKDVHGLRMDDPLIPPEQEVMALKDICLKSKLLRNGGAAGQSDKCERLGSRPRTCSDPPLRMDWNIMEGPISVTEKSFWYRKFNMRALRPRRPFAFRASRRRSCKFQVS